MSDLYGNIPISQATKKKPENSRPKKPSTPARPPQKPGGKRSSFGKYPLVIIASIMLVLAASYGLSTLFVPLLITKNVPEFFHKNTGLSLTINSVHFNPLNCSLILDSIAVASDDNEGNDNKQLLTINNLYADLDFISLLRNGIVTEKLKLTDATLTILRKADKSYNISQIFSRYGNNSSETMDFAELPFLYSLNNIEVVDSNIVFHDLNTEKIHKVEDLQLRLPTLSNFSFDASTYIQPHFSAIINGSPIELVGDTSEAAVAKGDDTQTTLSFSLRSIDIPLYSHYLPVPFPVQIQKGKTDGTLKISFLAQKGKGRHLTLQYQLQAKDIELVSHDKALLLTAPVMNLEGSLKPLSGDITLKNLLLRDPELVVKKTFSTATVDSLFLTDSGKTTTATPLQLPSLHVELLIADNGKITIADQTDKRVFHSIQLSMRNFANSVALRRNLVRGNGTFRLNGEADKDFSSFSWQGSFHNTVPSGSLEISNLQLARLVKLISPQAKISAKGDAEIKGTLSASRSRNNSSVLTLDFEGGTIAASSVSLADGTQEWFTSPSVKMSPVSYTDGQFNFGNIFTNSSKLQITEGQLPTFLKGSTTERHHQINGIDLKGEILFHSTKQKETAHLSNVHLQVKDLAKKAQKVENFTFSATSGKKGSIKAQGKIAFSPRGGEIDLAFTDLTSHSLTPWLSSSILGENTRLSGSGKYLLAAQKFTGSLEIINGVWQTPSSKYAFKRGIFSDLTTAKGFKRFSAAKVLMEDFDMHNNDVELAADRVALFAISAKKDSLHINEVSMMKSELTLQQQIPALLNSLADDRNGRVSIKKLKLDGRLHLNKAEENKNTSFETFNLTANNLGKRVPKKNNLSLYASTTTGGTLQIDGKLGLKPFSAKLALQLSNLHTEHLGFLQSAQLPSTMESKVDGSIQYNYPEGTSSGNLSLTDGRLIAKNSTKMMTWKKAILHGYTYSANPFHLRASKIELDTPELNYTQQKMDLFQQVHTHIKEAVGVSGAATDSASSYVEIGEVTVKNGRVNYRDERLSPPWSQTLTAVQGNLNTISLSSTTARSNFLLQGDMAMGNCSVSGDVQLSPNVMTAGYTLNISKFPLKILEKQLQETVGVDTDEATLELEYRRNDGEPDSGNIARFSFSSLRAQQNAHPTAQLLALLTGNNNTFSFEISTSSKEKPLFTQAVNHFQKLLVKSSISPFLVLPTSFSALQENKGLSFLPGETSLTAENRIVLAEYANLLNSRPNLRLNLKTVVDDPADRLALQKELTEEEKKRVEKTNEKLLQQLQNKHKEETKTTSVDNSIIVKDIPPEELEEYTPLSAKPIYVNDTMLLELGRKRFEHVLYFLTEKYTIPEHAITGKDNIVLSKETAQETPGIVFSLGYLPENNQQTIH